MRRDFITRSIKTRGGHLLLHDGTNPQDEDNPKNGYLQYFNYHKLFCGFSFGV